MRSTSYLSGLAGFTSAVSAGGVVDGLGLASLGGFELGALLTSEAHVGWRQSSELHARITRAGEMKRKARYWLEDLLEVTEVSCALGFKPSVVTPWLVKVVSLLCKVRDPRNCVLQTEANRRKIPHKPMRALLCWKHRNFGSCEAIDSPSQIGCSRMAASALPSLNLDRARVRPNDELDWRRSFLEVLNTSPANDLLLRLQRPLCG